MINLQDIRLQRGTKVLLEHASARIHPGQKIGLIGANGSGKSSLFKLLTGELSADNGECQIPTQWRIAHMAQEVSGSDRTALDYVLDGDTELRRIEDELAQHPSGERQAVLYAEMERIDGYQATNRAQQLLQGLGFSAAEQQKPVRAFSGGWRIRLNLAQALMCPSDLLLLDEPTNHLDLDTTLWLEQWLKRYPGTLLIISHDRDFLDNVVEQILNLHNAGLDTYRGNYSAYERQKAERLMQQQAAYEKQQQRMAEIDSFVRRFRAKASKAKQAQSRLKELQRMEEIAPAHIDSPFHFRIPCADKVSSNLLNMQQANLGYGDNIILHNVNINIMPDTRLGLLGANGAGKSTLIKTLASQLQPVSGERTQGEHLQLGYFSQHQLEALDLEASAALHIQRISPKAGEQEIRNYLGGFGFHGDRAFEVISHFSGGEKARLALALIAWQKPNLLLLDEPTNHLDLEMRHALTVALQDFAGAVIVISHDRHLLRNTVDDFLLVHNGCVEPFDGTLEDYQRWLYQEQKSQSAADKAASEPTIDRKEQRRQAAAQREQIKPLTQALKKAEKAMEEAEKHLAALEVQLSDTTLYNDDKKDQLLPLLDKQSEWQSRQQEAEEQWLELTEAIETAQAEFK